ncbi:MAG: phosphoenolpyruvate carboxykinase (ATP) [Chloroflexi bacterium 44-23]|nr:MAG: phosphoenolpyruvate carboxykinase (ATP) [Chloroflexi bacterium 44-23]
MIESSLFQFEIISRTTVQAKKIRWNLTPPLLYEEVVRRGEAMIAENGPLVIYTGKATGRSANDKFFVKESSSQDMVWWGKINKPFDAAKFELLKARILDYLSQKELYAQDCYGGADPDYRFPVRVVTDTAWQSLFAYNMFLHAENTTPKDFIPEFTVLVASGFESEPEIDGTRSDVAVVIHLGQKLALIAGSRYAGEIKKTVFTVLNYLYPLKDVLPMHCAANIGPDGHSALFFGLSGTGKTTLSADPSRRLIGDDEHGWSEHGIFNFEGGCYAKVINLSAEEEPQIYDMTQRFGTILENVVINPNTRKIDLNDETITENTRASYLIRRIANHEPSGMGGHPHNILLLTADAFGVLPPIALLTREQAMYYFLSGYTAKVAGTEKGIKEPQATFSVCFGGPFMVHHPMVYTQLLGERVQQHGSRCWLVNTGWTGGPYGVGSRIKIRYTRTMVDAILNGSLDAVEFDADPVFGVLIPRSCPGIPAEVLQPRYTWPNPEDYDAQAKKLASMFVKNFSQFADAAPPEVLRAGPII